MALLSIKTKFGGLPQFDILENSTIHVSMQVDCIAYISNESANKKEGTSSDPCSEIVIAGNSNKIEFFRLDPERKKLVFARSLTLPLPPDKTCVRDMKTMLDEEGR